MKLPNEEARARIQETIPRVHVSTLYGRDACCCEVLSSQDDSVIYQVLLIIDQGDLQASCGCPVWRNKRTWCKHIYASLVAWDREATAAHV